MIRHDPEGQHYVELREASLVAAESGEGAEHKGALDVVTEGKVLARHDMMQHNRHYREGAALSEALVLQMEDILKA